MFRRDLQPHNLLKITLAALLTVTLSGAYCLFGCQQIIAAAAHQPETHARRSENCHFLKTKAAEGGKTRVGVSGFAGCSLRFSFFIAKLEKQEFPQQALIAANNFNVFPDPLNSNKKAVFTGFRHRAPVPEGRRLYIKNCVFRI